MKPGQFIEMPTISMFYGIIIQMLYFDNREHHSPHIHAWYQGEEASISILDGSLLAGNIPSGKLRLVQAWIEIHRDDLLADWELAISGGELFKIEPLR